ncbi:olfactory receptor 5I1-like [Microcaecilia unicolor]|uniref:Olfactory receptor 5I1-like n=1 Tax=Microcaecilia unicolor TaxID=1415580 RepID=A0A6P7WSH7_9AMPH|nr:olfactory receptor 5I1-like [Microcaecilia unicolor]
MKATNESTVTEFILLGLTDDPHLKSFLFLLFLGLYILTLLSNIVIITMIKITPRLQTPMYFFLSHLSFLDLCYCSNITPNMLVNFLSEKKSISFLGCMVQLFIFCSLGSTQCLMLAVMAYDRYVAVCSPLLYTVIMTKKLCIQLEIAAYMGGIIHSLIQTGCTFRLSFCGSNVINHFACDFPPLLIISCTSTYINELVLFIFASLVSMGAFLIILISYVYILFTILKLHSTVERQKTFSTCASHLTCVTLLYGTVLVTYLRPSSSYSQEQDKVISLIYTVIIPFLNPLIYSLRNKEVKAAFRKVVHRTVFLH